MARPALVGTKLVGVTAGSGGNLAVSLTDITAIGGGTLTLLEDDYVFIFCGNTNTEPVNVGVTTAGWEELWDVSGASTYDISAAGHRKKMGATPDTTVDVYEVSASFNSGLVQIAVIRGGHDDLDVALAQNIEVDTNDAVWPGVSPTTAESLILAVYQSSWLGAGATPVLQNSTATMDDITGRDVDNSRDHVGCFATFDWVSGTFTADIDFDGLEYAGAANVATVLVIKPSDGGGGGSREGDENLGRWTGGAVSILPTTSWAAPVGMFPTEETNENGAFLFNSATSEITLPETDLPDLYIIEASYELVDTSNGRCNPQGRLSLVSGTGDFRTGTSTGFDRDNSEDTAWVKTWAVIRNPSAGAKIDFEWRRDTDAPLGGTARASFSIKPVWGSNIAIYESTSTACPGGSTPNQVTGFSVVHESDTDAIELVANVVNLKGDNKRYLCIGSQYFPGIGNARTQRWHGFRVDGTKDDKAKGYSYARNAANADIGEMFSTIITTATATRTLDQFVYRGEPIGTFPNNGADVDGNTTGSAGCEHVMLIVELHDNAEVFVSHSTTQQDIDAAGVRVDLQIADVLDENDAASFVKQSATEIRVKKASDYLIGANVSGGYASTSTARYSGYAEFTLDGVGQADHFAGDYGRGNQSTTDCWGWSANLFGWLSAAVDQDIGVNAGKIVGGEGGTVDTFGGEVGFWGINLKTLKPSAAPGETVYVGSEGGSAVFVGAELESELYVGALDLYP